MQTTQDHTFAGGASGPVGDRAARESRLLRGRFRGRVYGRRGTDDGKLVTTSHVRPEGRHFGASWIRTESGSTYALGLPARVGAF